MRIRTKITLWFTILVASLNITLNIFSFIVLKKYIYQNSYNELKLKAEEVIIVLNILNKENDWKKNIKEIFHNFDSHNFYMQLSLNDKVIFRSTNLLDISLPDIKQNKDSVSMYKDTLAEKDILIYNHLSNIHKEELKTQIAVSLDSQQKFLRSMIIFQIMETLIAIIISLFMGWFLSGRALAPIIKLNSQVHKMNSSEVIKSRFLATAKMENDEIKELAETFNVLFDNINKTLDSQKRFIEDASHELRTPLTSIHGYAQLLRKRGKTHQEIFDESLTAIVDETERLKRLVNELFYIANFGNIAIKMNLINLKELFAEIKRNLAPNNPCLHIYVEKDAFINGNKDALKRAFLNIIYNAIKAISDKKDKGKVEVFGEETATTISIFIKDNGIGIPAEKTTKIFERFYRLDSSRSRELGGTGIGLSIVKEIVDLHHGKIKVTSTPGENTTFQITFNKPLGENLI